MSGTEAFSVNVITDSSISRVMVAGDVDSAQAVVLASLCSPLIGASKNLEIDLAEVNYFGVAATETVLDLQKRAVSVGAQFQLVSVPKPIANLLDLVERAKVDLIADVSERALPQMSAEEFNEIVAKGGLKGREGLCVTGAELDEPGPEILLVNRAFTEITGYRADDVLGKNPRFLHGELSDRTVLDRLREDLSNGRPFEGEMVNYRKDGSPFIMNWKIVGVRSSAGRPFFVAMQRDSTEFWNLRRFERAVGFLNGQLESVDGSANQGQAVVLSALERAMVILLEGGEVRIEPGGTGGARVPVLQPEAGTLSVPIVLPDGGRSTLTVSDLHPDEVRLVDEALLVSLVDHAMTVIEHR